MNKIQVGVLFGVAIAAAGTARAQAVPVAPTALIQGTRLEVNAVGDVTRVPDMATVNAGVVTQARSAQAAMAGNAERMARAIAALKEAGVQPRDIQTSAISLSPQYRYADNVPPALTGYQASNQVSIRFRDIQRAGRILDALVAVGANQIDGPNFAIDQPEAALDEARRAAITKARARAELYASAAGLSVARIVSISEGSVGDQPPRPPIAMMAARVQKAEDTAIEAGEQKLSVSLSVIFELR
jgi:uncharacterized protein YggE